MAITRSQIARQLLQQGGVSMDERSTEDLIDARMAMSYDENRARNEFQRGMNQMYRQKMDQLPGIGTLKLSDIDQTGFSRPVTQEDVDTYNFIPPGFDASDPLTGMRQTDMLPGPVGMRSLAEMDAIRKRVLAAQEAQQRADSGLVDSVTGKRYMSQQEAIDDLGIVTYNQRFAEGGEVSNSPGNTTLQRVLPRMDGKRPGYFGPDAGEGGKESDFGQDTYSTSDVDFGGVSGGSDAQFDAAAEAIAARTPSKLDTFRANTLKKQIDYMRGNTNLFGLVNPRQGPALNVYDKNFQGPDLDQYGMSGKDLTRSQNIQDALDTFQETGQLSQSKFNEVFGAKGPTKTIGDNSEPIRPPIIPKLPSDIEPEKSDYDEFVQRFTLPERFRLAEGGEPRQAYGLGKLVKKVTGAVKKVAKSDIGKAALIGAAAFGIPGMGASGGLGGGIFGRASFGGYAPGMFGFGGIGNALGAMGINKSLLGTSDYQGGPTSLFGSIGKFIKEKPMTAILGTSLAAGLLTPKQEEEVDSLSKRISDNTGIDVEQIRKEVQKATAEGQDSLDALKAKYPFLLTADAAKADGGRIEKAIGGVINEEDEMLNMGGNEMDLRGGGFVPLGEYEKKDDVPARLSKNEFVFTADAVRAAGGGSVDRGADLMYKTMKQLENKVV